MEKYQFEFKRDYFATVQLKSKATYGVCISVFVTSVVSPNFLSYEINAMQKEFYQQQRCIVYSFNSSC